MESDTLYCSICNSKVENADEICIKCGSDLTEFEDSSPTEIKYRKLIILKDIIRVIFSLLGVLLIIGLLYGIYKYDFLIVSYVLFTASGVLMLFFWLEIVNLLIDVEQNTRSQIKLLYKLLKR